jgi:hypothetical protein
VGTKTGRIQRHLLPQEIVDPISLIL